MKAASNYNFSTMEKLLIAMDEFHSGTDLAKLKNELNKFFTSMGYKTKCRDILYTNNTDKLFFGSRVYPILDADDVSEVLGDRDPKPFKGYYLELDSKLFDPMLNLTGRELTAIILHEVGHIVYDENTVNEVKKQVDLYFANNADYFDTKASYSYRELIAYALKDAIMKAGSLFTKVGNTETIADSFVVSCGYGEDLVTAFRKISHSSIYLNKDVDNRWITLAWVLRLRAEFDIRRAPAIKTLNKAKQLTASKLEERELDYALKTLTHMNSTSVSEGFIEDIRDRFSTKFKQFKINGIKSIKNDVYELELRLRAVETFEDAMYIIRQCNTDIAILQDYLTEDIADYEKKSCLDTLSALYTVRDKAAKEVKIFNTNNSFINVIYPNMDD